MKKYMHNKAKDYAMSLIKLIFQNEIYYEDIIKKELEDAIELEMKLKEANTNALRKGSNASQSAQRL